MYNNLFLQASKPGFLYGLLKVHKANWPARPIMSDIGMFNYALTGNQYTVHNSFSFVDEITQLTLSHGAVMVSFDG